MTGFDEFLQSLTGEREPNLLDMHKAFSVIATLYIEDALNLVNDAVSAAKTPSEILAQADVLFHAWEHELFALKFTIKNLGTK